MKTQTIYQIAISWLAAITILCCSEKEIEPINLLSNGDVETGSIYPEPWYPYTGNEAHNFVWSKVESSSGERSLKLNSKLSTDKIAYWVQTIKDDLPLQKNITLKVNIKADLEGTGASIVIRADGEDVKSGSLQFETTQGDNPITGTFDWKEHSITLENLDPETKKIVIFLIYLPETTGGVFFDDISLIY